MKTATDGVPVGGDAVDAQRLVHGEGVAGAASLAIGGYDVDGAQHKKRRVLYSADEGGQLDGFRLDTAGNLWCGYGGSEATNGVRVLAPDGTPLLHIQLPERCANLCFGGARKNRLFMASSHSLYALHVNAQGAL